MKSRGYHICSLKEIVDKYERCQLTVDDTLRLCCRLRSLHSVTDKKNNTVNLLGIIEDAFDEPSEHPVIAQVTFNPDGNCAERLSFAVGSYLELIAIVESDYHKCKMSLIDGHRLELAVHIFYRIDRDDAKSFEKLLEKRRATSQYVTMEYNLDQPQLTQLKNKMIANGDKILRCFCHEES